MRRPPANDPTMYPAAWPAKRTPMSPMPAPERSRSSVNAGPSTLSAIPSRRNVARYSRTERGHGAASVMSPVGYAGARRAASAGGDLATGRGAGAGEHRQQSNAVDVALRALGRGV